MKALRCEVVAVVVVVVMVVVTLDSCCCGALVSRKQPILPYTPGIVRGPLTEVMAVVGGEALLPCDINEPGDTPILVLFYNGETGKPVYSIDSRTGTLTSSMHWSAMGDRAHFNLTSSPTGLHIIRVEAQDHGEYRCRVDFRRSPTRNLQVKLLVVVPPHKLQVYVAGQREVREVVGPFPLGTSVTLTCEATGGRPMPRVTWWHEGSLLDDLSEETQGQVTWNTLTLPDLTRQHLHRVITCQAANSNLTQPLRSSVTLDMSFPPEDVAIRVPSTPLREGETQELVCEAGGSRPPAALTWWLRGRQLPAPPTQLLEGTVTRSTLSFTPSRQQDGAKLTCRAQNTQLPSRTLEDTVTLTVYYAPRVELRAGQSLVMSSIKEGDDVYFECVISANPPVQGLRWLLQGEILHHNLSAGVILTNQSLVLQRVGRHSSGRYTCAASNVLGTATSKPLILNVKFRPVCSARQQWTYGGARGQQVNVTCQVDANPAVHSFRWAFNTSTEMVHIPKNRSRVQGSRSIMAYTPKTHHDFGTLLCWADNEVGVQRLPCVYLVVPASVPESVHNCSAWHNASAAGEVVVVCEPGWGGGLPQTFSLEVRRGGITMASLGQRTEPFFTVTGLAPGTEYELAVVASNTQGTATPTHLTHHTPIDVAEKRTSATAAESFGVGLGLMRVMPVVVVAVVAGISLVLCSVVVVLLIRCRLARAHAHSHAHARPKVVCEDPGSITKTFDDGGFDVRQRDPDLILVKAGRRDPQPTTPAPRPPTYGTVTSELASVRSNSPAEGSSLGHTGRSSHSPGPLEGARVSVGSGGLGSNESTSSSAALHSAPRIPRPLITAQSPVPLGRMGRSASCLEEQRLPLSTTSSLPRRSSTLVLHPEFFPLNLSTSRESCV